MFRKLAFLILWGMLVLSPLAQAPHAFMQSTSVPRIGDAGGRWETAASADGIVDMLRLTEAPTLMVEMFRRKAGWDGEFGRATPGHTWDGRRLRARIVSQVYPDGAVVLLTSPQSVISEVDIAYDLERSRWIGTITRNGQTHQVELRRPGRFTVGPSLQPFLGRWCSVPADTTIRCFTVEEGADGVASGWNDRARACNFSNELATRQLTDLLAQVPHVGACGFTVDIAADSRMIFVGERGGLCCPNWFSGQLSVDGRHIDGIWTFGKSGTTTKVSFVKVN